MLLFPLKGEEGQADGLADGAPTSHVCGREGCIHASKNSVREAKAVAKAIQGSPLYNRIEIF